MHTIVKLLNTVLHIWKLLEVLNVLLTKKPGSYIKTKMHSRWTQNYEVGNTSTLGNVLPLKKFFWRNICILLGCSLLGVYQYHYRKTIKLEKENTQWMRKTHFCCCFFCICICSQGLWEQSTTNWVPLKKKTEIYPFIVLRLEFQNQDVSNVDFCGRLWRRVCPMFISKTVVVVSCSVVSDSFATPSTVAPPGSCVHGILQARILEMVAISFSICCGNCWQFLLSFSL